MRCYINLVMEEVSQQQSGLSGIVRKFPKSSFKSLWPYVVGSLLVVSLGVGIGWFISTRSGGSMTKQAAPGAKSGPKEAGLADEKTFTDSAEGVLEDGGIVGEGTHHLVRPGGESQNVYLTSTVIDLSSFVGKKVTVWGQTISARKAGWLMDVGKIKVTE